MECSISLPPPAPLGRTQQSLGLTALRARLLLHTGDASVSVDDAFIASLGTHTETAQFRPSHAQLDQLLTRDTFSAFRKKLLTKKATKTDLLNVIGRLRIVVSATTSSRFQSINQLLLDGDIPGAAGQRDVALQYAFRGSQLLCAKIGPCAKLQHEADVWHAVSTATRTPALLPILEALPMPHGEAAAASSPRLLVLVMPLCGMTVGAASCAFEPERTNDRAVLLVNTAICAGAAAAAYATAGWVHGDIKPPNLMLLPSGVSVPGVVALADFGSAVAQGGMARESTPGFGLDAAPGTWQYDIACFASTLAQLLSADITLAEFTSVKLAAFAGAAGSAPACPAVLTPLWQLVALSAKLTMDLERPSSAAMAELHSILADTSSAVRQILVAGQQEILASTLLSLESVWPQPRH